MKIVYMLETPYKINKKEVFMLTNKDNQQGNPIIKTVKSFVVKCNKNYKSYYYLTDDNLVNSICFTDLRTKCSYRVKNEYDLIYILKYEREPALSLNILLETLRDYHHDNSDC